MTPEEMRDRVNQLRDDVEHGPDHDPEKWHGEEYAIYTAALRAIAEGYADDPRGVAAVALGAARIKFPRWTAA
jgi:hypothetical protein